jgi:ankyrin repeat protein
MIEVLLQAGAKVKGEDNGGNTPMHRAAFSLSGKDRPGDIMLLINAGADVNHKNHAGKTPLHKARSGDIAEALVRTGADIHSRDHCIRTPLHRASSAKVAEALLRAGADVNSRDCRNLTPLHLVWQNRGNGCGIDLARVLINAGADLSACADIGPDFWPHAGDPVWTPIVWIWADAPSVGCRVPFGPSRSERAALARRQAKHSEILAYLQELNTVDLLKT